MLSNSGGILSPSLVSQVSAHARRLASLFPEENPKERRNESLRLSAMEIAALLDLPVDSIVRTNAGTLAEG
ncbi:MAG: hypothetical protein WCP58_09250 [bacterium]